MKISVDHVTNSSSESFGTVIVDTATAIGLAIPFIAVTLGGGEGGDGDEALDVPQDDWGYEPHESTDPNDPPGTIVQNNRDGSVTKTHPDGAVGTKMPDGTIYVSEPDGTTGVIEPDGHQKMTLPDGTKVEHYTDGTSYAEYPDGTERVEYEDGTVRQKNPEGEIVKVNPDGSFDVTPPGSEYTKHYTEEGSLYKATHENGGEINIDEDGNVKGVIKFPDGDDMEVEGVIGERIRGKSKSGNSFELNESGELDKLYVKNEYGFIEVDGEKMKIDVRDEKTGEFIKVDFDPDKHFEYEDSNGNFVKLDKDGKGTAKLKTDQGEFNVREDGSMDYQDDEITMNRDAEGRTEIVDSKGNYQISNENPDGSVDFEIGNKEGSQVTGSIDENGNYEANGNDGSQIVITDEGVSIKDSEGNNKHYTRDDIEKFVAEQQAKEGGQ